MVTTGAEGQSAARDRGKGQIIIHQYNLNYNKNKGIRITSL